MTGFTQQTSGELYVCGINTQSNLTDARKIIGYCPQTNPIYEKLTCAEQLRLAAKLRGAYHGDNDVHQILQDVGLGDAIHMLTGQLSGGMKRKLCVALALVGKSKVVLLDEPTAGIF